MIELKRYIQGKGIDVGKIHTISEAEYMYMDPGNLYLLRNEVGVESYDYLYSYNFINEIKYYRILLYEWFIVVRPQGYIIIDFEENEILDLSSLKKEITTLFIYKDRHQIVEETIKGRKGRIVIKKTVSIKKDEEEINQWTFGIITNGRRKEFLEQVINSIRALKIPQYEIIICGTYYGKIGKDMRYIHFTEKDDKGWITKKKNLICQAAKYPNIVVIHDRICFHPRWFEGMKRYGNYFDVLTNPVILTLKNGKKVISNWETLKEDFKLEDDRKLFHTNGILDFADWDRNVIIPGPLIILKKYVWEKEKWNEDFFWGEAEDIEYSHRQHRRGIMIRLNPYAQAYALNISGVTYRAYYERDYKKLGRYRCELPSYLVYTLKFLDFLGFRRNQRLVSYFIKKLKKKYQASSWKEERGQ